MYGRPYYYIPISQWSDCQLTFLCFDHRVKSNTVDSNTGRTAVVARMNKVCIYISSMEMYVLAQ